MHHSFWLCLLPRPHLPCLHHLPRSTLPLVFLSTFILCMFQYRPSFKTPPSRAHYVFGHIKQTKTFEAKLLIGERLCLGGVCLSGPKWPRSVYFLITCIYLQISWFYFWKNIVFIFKYFKHSVVYMYHIFLIYFQVNRHQGWFHFLAPVNWATVNMSVKCLCIRVTCPLALCQNSYSWVVY